MTRPLSTIAREIRADWRAPYFGAVPYLQAMSLLGGMSDIYGYDSADSVVRYFLGNAATWRGTQYGDNTQTAHCRRLKRQP